MRHISEASSYICGDECKLNVNESKFKNKNIHPRVEKSSRRVLSSHFSDYCHIPSNELYYIFAFNNNLTTK